MTSALLHDFFSSNNQIRSTRRTWPGMTVLVGSRKADMLCLYSIPGKAAVLQRVS
jgi:hypothetical protein